VTDSQHTSSVYNTVIFRFTRSLADTSAMSRFMLYAILVRSWDLVSVSKPICSGLWLVGLSLSHGLVCLVSVLN